MINSSIRLHNWSFQPFSLDYDLASHATYVVCVNFILDLWSLQFNVVFERQIFEKLFHGRFIYSHEFLSEICWEKVVEEICFFIFSFWCLMWDTNPSFTSNKPTLIYSLKSTPKDRSSWKTFQGNFILHSEIYQITAERMSPKKYFHILVLMSGLGFDLGDFQF